MKQTLTELKAKTYSNKIIVGDFSTQLSKLDRTHIQNISKKTEDLNNNTKTTETQSDVHRTHILSSACDIFFSKDHMLGSKTDFNKFKKTEIISNTFVNQNRIKLNPYNKENWKNP